MKINRQDTNGVKPLLAVGELGYDNYPSGGDIGRVYVGTGSSNIAQAKKSEVVTVDGKVDTHVARIDNPHGVTKTQVGLSNVDNTSDMNKPVSTAIQTALNLKANLASPALTGTPTAPTASVGTSSTMVATTAFVNAEIANDAVPRVVSTDNAIVRFDGTTGKVQNSGVIIDDTNHMGIGTSSVLERVTLPQGNDGRVGWSSGTATIGAIYMDSSDNVKIMGRNGAANSAIDRITLDPAGNVLVTGTGGLGYGLGSGGMVTQLTSKATEVTLNKPTGQIIVNNAALAAGAEVSFTINNSLVSPSGDTILVGGLWSSTDPISYRIELAKTSVTSFIIRVTNITGVSLSESLIINFILIKGANS